LHQPRLRMTSYDSTWKDALEAYFPAFMELLFPEPYAGIDWDREYTFRDKELQKLDPRSAKGTRTVDKLVEVHRTDGIDALVYVHVEVQSQPQSEFPRRMFVYHYRLFDKYDGEVVSLAVLADDTPGWNPSSFVYELWGCRLQLRFPVAKLLDFEERWDELMANENPFAVVIQAHLKTLRTRDRPVERKHWKLAILRGLYDRGWGRDEIRQMFRFIDGLMTLPEQLDKEFTTELESMEEEKAMPYVSSVERVYTARGREEGELNMARKNILEVLDVRFGDVPERIISAVQSVATTEECAELHRAAITAESMDVFEKKLGTERDTGKNP